MPEFPCDVVASYHDGILGRMPSRAVGEPQLGVPEIGARTVGVRDHLRARVAGPDHREGEPVRLLGRILGSVGQLDLPDDMVTQMQRLGDAPKPLVPIRYVVAYPSFWSGNGV